MATMCVIRIHSVAPFVRSPFSVRSYIKGHSVKQSAKTYVQFHPLEDLSFLTKATSGGTDSMDSRAANQLYVHVMALMLLFVTACHVQYHAVLAESQSSTPAEGSEQDEKQRDFMAWIERVDSRYYSGTLSRPMDSDDELAASKAVGGVITVGGSGAQFSKVQDAVDAVSPGNGQRIVIQIAAGVYKEKVHVPSNKPYITFQGAGAGSTTITWQDTLASAGTLAKSATVGIDARGFIAKGISFVNSSPPPPIGSKNRQAVALRISGDQAAFYNCNFLSSQDTLYDDEGRHYFEGCLIQGSVDFICGNGQSLYKGCELRAVQRSTESLTAQRRSSPNENTGFSFVNCKVTGEGMAYLGRAWGEYSRVIFSYTYMANVVKPVGWYNWGDSSRENKVFYGQYKCSGPGADESKRVGWSKELTDAQAAPFQTVSFIDGSSWLQS